jgi:hypothetical protein
MKIKIYFIALFAIALVFAQCKKKKHDTVTPVAPTYTNVCTGNTSDTKYIPLTVGNTWTYVASTLIGNTTVVSTVTKDTVAFGKTYFVATYTPAGLLSNSYQRYNASGDLVALDSLAQHSSHEAILIPGTPYNSQVFINNAAGISSVINTNASISTSAGCSYTGLLEIQAQPTGQPTITYYYKKGIGLVYLSCSGSAGGTCNFSTAYLSSMTIH